MGQAVYFEGANMRLGPPEGMTEEECYTMYAYQGNNHIVSCWHLTDEEIDEIVRTRCVWLSVMGNGAPPTFVGSLDNTKDLLSYYNKPEEE